MPTHTPETDTPKTPLFEGNSTEFPSTNSQAQYFEYLRTLGTTDRTRLSAVLNGRNLAQLKHDTEQVYAGTNTEGRRWAKTSIIRDYWELGTGGGAQKFGRTLWDVLQIGALKDDVTH